MNDFNYIKSKKIWLAGHNGLVGSSLKRNLSAIGCDVLTISRKKLDLTDYNKVKLWMQKNKPEIVIIAAARVGGILANKNYCAQFITENLKIQTNIIEIAHKISVEKLIFLGSSCIYPLSENKIKESDLLTGKLEKTNSSYAIAKIAGIEMCESYYRQYGSNFISLQPCNIYGEKDNFSLDDGHVIPSMIHKFHIAKKLKKKKVSLWGSGKPLREFLYVDDLSDIIIRIINSNYIKDRLLNIGSGEEVSIKKLSEIIKKVVEFKGEVFFDKSFPDGAKRKLLDSSKISCLKWKPKISLEKGINLSYSWFLKKVIKDD